MLIVGGSYIGTEFGQAFRRLGSKVTVFEQKDRIIFREDPEFSTTAQSIFEQEGIEFYLNSSIISITKDSKGLTLHFKQGE